MLTCRDYLNQWSKIMLSIKEKALIGDLTRKFSFNEEILDKRDKVFAQFMMSKESATGPSREWATLSKCGFDNLEDMHGYDGFDPETERNVEVKSESVRGTKVVTKLHGGMSWGGKKKETYDKILKENPIIVVSGFNDDGKCVYIVKFDMKDSSIRDEIAKGMKARKSGKETAIKATWTSFKNAESLEVVYYEPRYGDNVVRDFKTILDTQWTEKRKAEMSKLTRSEMIDLIAQKSKEEVLELLLK